MKNWTEKAISALYVGNLVHKNNWHAIKSDLRFGPWLVNFSEKDLRNWVKADEAMFGKSQPTRLNQEGISGVNQPNIWQEIKADPRFGSILSRRSEDDIKNKFEADLEFFGVNRSEIDGKDKVNDDAEKFENWKTNEAFALCLGVIKYGRNNWDAIKADLHFGPLLVERDAYSCRLKYQHDLDKLERDILAMQQQASQDTGVPEPVRAIGAGGETSRGARARDKKKGKGCRR
ncbi:uncharacterized protein LOC123907305 [Trifolium pratense]|uniref:uncharacterized protein LOC123907305 n=1 Tax=Trifolium pratense TaxID=57577 RepID=UPI001E6976C3|nr:uncharacterized protein LOC123907305 [Trifolium pratense]